MKNFKTYLIEDSAKSVAASLFLLLRRKLNSKWDLSNRPSALGIIDAPNFDVQTKAFFEAKKIITAIVGKDAKWKVIDGDSASVGYRGSIVSIIKLKDALKITVS